MSIFDNYLGNWIQIIDEQNDITIEDYKYDTGIIKGTTDNHCVKCVAVNKCLFKNEKNKKPEHYIYSKDNIVDTIVKGLFPGLYHYRCHCKEVPIEISSVDDIQLIIPDGKTGYLFTKKLGWINYMGYYEKDYDNFLELLLKKTKEAYLYGNYYIEDLSKHGCKINLQIDIPGINDKKGQIFKIETNYMVFPNGKLKMNTPIGGWQN